MNTIEKETRRVLLERARQHMVGVAALFEGGLAVLAWFLGWLFSYPLMDTIDWRLDHVAYGVLWTLPLIPSMWWISRSRWRPFRRIQQIIGNIIVPLFSGCSLFQLALISFLAGWGEEALFRGFVQYSIAENGSTVGAIAIASLLFGLAHLITPAYAILAMLIGVYLGWLMTFHDNLLVAVTVHALYDFVALVYLLRLHPRSQQVLERSMRQMEKLLDEHKAEGDEVSSPENNDAETRPPDTADGPSLTDGPDSS